MKYRRVLLLAQLQTDVRAAIAAIRRVAPEAEQLVVVAWLPGRSFGWLSGDAPPDLHEETDAAIDELRAAAAGAAAALDVRFAPDLNAAGLEELATSSGIDLLVAGSLPLSSIPIVVRLRKQRSLAVLWVPQSATPRDDRSLTELLCVARGLRARASVAAFLRDRGDLAQRATVLLIAGSVAHDPSAAIEVAGIRTPVEHVTAEGDLQAWLDERIQTRPIDLLVFARFPARLLLRAQWQVPMLLLPPAPSAWSLIRRDIDAPDLIDGGEPLRARFEYATGVGRRTPLPDQEIAFVADGQIAAVVATQAGDAELPAECRADSYGVFRVEADVPSDPVLAVEQWVRVLRPGTAPLVLFDAELSDAELAALRGREGAWEALAVRIRPTRSCRSIRERLLAARLPSWVIDGGLVLDEGAALDVPDAFDAVRLARVATRLRGAGFPVAAIVYRGEHEPAVNGFAALRPHELASARLERPAAVERPVLLDARLDATIAAPRIPGNRVEVEIDNGKARHWLLGAIDASTRRVHAQVYIVADDEIGRQVEAALVRASERGVGVRLLVDSLHGFHGSFGVRNPLLERLGARPGIEVRVSRPITGLPSVADLKQRDHRKLVVVDNEVALLGGRNFSHEYYAGFDEVALTPDSPWREVPWLDAGARVEGPAVATLERSFLEAWTEAGGAPFEIAEVAPAGPTQVRVVIHRGLHDAHTLETYLALIDTAQDHIYVVNGFPLILEIQHALLRALRRGVRVRALFGHLTPTHAGEPFGGPWAAARFAATELVHSRMDALIEAGGEGHQFMVAEQPAWAPGLGAIASHVHAKVVSADGRVCAVGSANLDITAGYWENEVLLAVEDASVAGALEARIEALLAGSVRVERDDPQWQAQAKRRAWMRYWPSLFSM